MDQREDNTDWIKSFYDSAAEWWGESWYEGENLKPRLDLIENYAGDKEHRILELAAGTGETAAYFCDHGYAVLAVDISQKNVEFMTQLQKSRPNLRVMEGNFLEVAINERFPIICLFESFGFGSDKDQRQLLKRISEDWLLPDGVVIMDVYHPFGPIRAAGKKQELEKLDDVAGSVDMIEHSGYDPIKSRWIDIWEPKDDKESMKIQSIRCYTPADFMLLADGLGLSIDTMLFCGKEFDFTCPDITTDNFFDDENNYSYTVILRKASCHCK